MTRREFLNLYLVERHVEEVAYKLTLLGVRAYYLSRYTVRDWTRRALGHKGGRP